MTKPSVSSHQNESLKKHNHLVTMHKIALRRLAPTSSSTTTTTRTAHKLTMIKLGQLALVVLLVAAATSHLQAAILVPSPNGQQPTSGQPNVADSSQISPGNSPANTNSGHASLSSVSSQETQQQQAGGQLAAGNELTGATMSNSIGLPPMSSSSQQQQPINQAQMGIVSLGNGASPSALAAINSVVPSKSAQPLVLPKINIYVSRSEVKKLLGIDSSISYITSGKLEEYPLGFTIPLGYHSSDMIFTWQNLGPTNVNYSISLVIGNIQAVERPLINITRSGLIPRHEQVFKITLPCSGKITDEVDVQILINIMGLVPVAASQQQLDSDNIFGSAVGDTNSAAGGEAQQPSAADYQLARAIQQQNELLAAATSGSLTNSSTGDQMMQADQQPGDGPSKRAPFGAPVQQAQMRMVSHTIAIKRKKICTMHPVPVQPMPRLIDVRPPNQPPAIGAGDHTAQSKWSTSTTQAPLPAADQQPSTTTNSYQSSSSSPASQQQQQPQTPVAEPSHHPIFSSMTEASVSTVGQSLAMPPGRLNPMHFGKQQQPAAIVASGPVITRRGGGSGQVSQQQHQQPAAANQAQVDATNAGQQQQTGAAAASNPLLFTLIVMSLIISVALIALLVLGSASSSYSHSSRRASPLDKLTALTNCIWRRTSAGSRAVNKCTKNVGPITIKNGIIGTFGCATSTATSLANGRNTTSSSGHNNNHHHHHHHAGNGLKSNVSSMSGLSTISGLNNKHHNQNISSLVSPYCQKQQHANYNTSYYHHYQQPPDLLIGATSAATTTTSNATNSFHHSPISSPYQITMSNNQMTKLFLANPANSGTYSIDNNFMPIAANNSTSATSSNVGFQAPHSDSGSVYQTIY